MWKGHINPLKLEKEPFGAVPETNEASRGAETG